MTRHVSPYEWDDRPSPRRASIRASKLTEREADVLKLVCLGYSNKEIGRELKISWRTAAEYRHRMMVRFNARNAQALVFLAMTTRLISTAHNLRPAPREDKKYRGSGKYAKRN